MEVLERTILSAAEWQERAAAHRARALAGTRPTRERKARRESHPVFDFLHTYYSFSFAKLEQWHPGYGISLELSDGQLPAYLSRPPYGGSSGCWGLDLSQLTPRRRDHLGWIHHLLMTTQDRAPNFACHGLHEWAMVYSGAAIRHRETVPLRLPQDEIDSLVDAHPLCCTHYDAFRFFAPATRPRNRFAPDLSDREHHEQPGCIHANMDLYKWAFKSMPWIGSDLLWECFLFSTRCREIDMRASPYDLTSLGYQPIKIETEAGRRAYEQEQLRLMNAGRVLRARLVDAIAPVLAGTGPVRDGVPSG